MSKKLIVLVNLLLLVSNLVYSQSFNLRVYANIEKNETGIYLTKGTKIEIRAKGKWRMGDSPGYKTPVDFRGNLSWVPHPNNKPNGCLIAYLNDKMYFPDDNGITIEASEDGLLSFGPNDGGVSDNHGYLDVTVNVTKGKVYDVLIDVSKENYKFKLKKALQYPEDMLILLRGKYTGHIIAVRAVAKITNISEFIDFFDEAYQLMYELAGRKPFGGERIYYKAVPNFSDVKGYEHNKNIYMLSGNPIRYRADAVQYLFYVTDKNSVSQWAFLHEMGHDFSWVLKNHYMEDGLVEVGANIFTLYVWEKMGLINQGNARDYFKKTKDWWNSGKDLKKLQKDNWAALGLFMTIVKDYGWKSFKYFYRHSDKGMFAQINNWRDLWDNFCFNLSKGAGVDLSPRLKAWGINVSGYVKRALKDLKKDDKWAEWERKL